MRTFCVLCFDPSRGPSNFPPLSCSLAPLASPSLAPFALYAIFPRISTKVRRQFPLPSPT